MTGWTITAGRTNEWDVGPSFSAVRQSQAAPGRGNELAKLECSVFFGLCFLVVSGCLFPAVQLVFGLVGGAVPQCRVESRMIVGSVSIHEATSLMAFSRVGCTTGVGAFVLQGGVEGLAPRHRPSTRRFSRRRGGSCSSSDVWRIAVRCADCPGRVWKIVTSSWWGQRRTAISMALQIRSVFMLSAMA